MPRKAKNDSASSAVNGGKAKKARLDVNDASDESDEEESAVNHSGAAAAPKVDLVAFSNRLLREMELAAPSKGKIRDFDFDQIHIEGHSSEELRAQYDRLRKMAFRKSRELSLKKEIQFVREYSQFENMKTVDKSEKFKRPITPYIRFMMDNRKKLLKRNPDARQQDLIKLAAEEWREASGERKRPYQEAYDKEKNEFYREHPELVKKASKTVSKDKQKRTAGPKSTFDLFSEAKTKEYSDKYDLKGDELKQKLASKFAKLSDKKRQKWENRAREAMDEYIQALANSGSQATVKVEAPEEVSIEDPILAESPVDKKEKKAKKAKISSDMEHDDSPSKNARSSKKDKAAKASNEWL